MLFRSMDGDNLGYPSIYTSSPKGRGYLMVSYTFDTLMWKDENGLIPYLAESYTISEDNKTFTFTLRDGIKFSDGEPLTSEDVKFSFEYLAQYPYQWISVSPVKEVTAPDEKTVVIELNDVYMPFLSDIAGNVPVMPKHIWENITEPEKFNTEEAVIGSGPLMLEEYDQTTGVYIYKKNPNYFYGDVQVDKLIISPINDTKQALLAGEIDVAAGINFGNANAIKKENPEYKVIEGAGLWVGRIYFNFDIPEFNDVNLRKAFAYGINRDEIVEKALKNGAIAGNPGYLHPSSEWYSSDITNYDFSTEKAKEHIELAGATGKNYELIAAEDMVSVAEMVSKYLTDAGLSVTVKSMDQQSVAAAIKEGKFDIAINGHGSFGGDPVLLSGFASPVTGGSTPAVTLQGGKRWTNERFDEIFTKQLGESDINERKALVAELQKILSDEIPSLPLYYKKTASAYNPEVFDGWFYTKDGISLAVPTIHNKLVFSQGTWNK